ncbi:MAG: Gfo/Idh/MocA family oxidoreductase, partial [Thermoguttaceae bacterium]
MSERSRVSRRQFLGRTAAAAGAALAAPYCVSASALGKDGATPPSDRIPMGFVGLGGQGGGHLFGGAWTYLPGGYLARPDVQVMAVCDVQRKRAEGAKAKVEQHYAQKYGEGSYAGCTAYDDIRNLLLRNDIDAVLIAAAYHCQGLMASLAARAGKDVYCEKPTSITIRWGRAMVETFRAHGRIFQAGTQQRSEYDGRFYRAVSLVRGGAIGKLQRVYAYQKGGGFSAPSPGDRGDRPIPPDVNWEAYVGPLPWFPYDGNTGAHRFGWGDINWGQHHYDIVQWGIGSDDTGPVEIRMEGATPVYRYANGVEVYGCPPPGEAWNQGGACFIGANGKITVHRTVLTSDPADILKQSPGPGGNIYHSTSHSGNFLECVRTRQRTIADIETAHRANSVL